MASARQLAFVVMEQGLSGFGPEITLADLDTLPTADQAPPRSAIDDLIPGQLPAEDLDPLATGILMQHQKDWLADRSPLKLAEKGRRTGMTFAEALDSTLIAASSKQAGGDHTFYIGDTKDKSLEFVATCARFASTVAKELVEIGEFLFEDQQPDGTSKYINAYRIRFASGFQIVGLSSSPSNIRGLQGRVIIDEAAFHRNVAAVLDAVNALLIWGGVIRIISSHNGVLNAFNELIKETREGIYDYSLHRVTFDDAVENGLYERVCLIRGWTPSTEGKAEWYRRVRRSYGSRIEAMREELDAIPREGEGTLLPLAWIEAASQQEYLVKRWTPPAPGRGLAEFTYWPEDLRRADMLAWLEREIRPVLDLYRPTASLLEANRSGSARQGQRHTWFLGGDFAMRQDRSSYPIGFVDERLRRHVPLILELAQCPYDQQRQALFWLVDYLQSIGRFGGGVLDANGNGMALAQECAQAFGQDRIVELMPSDAWRREYGPPFRAAFEDQTILIPADMDTRDDLRQLQMIGGVAKMPTNIRKEGSDGGRRHGDNAVGLWNFYAATLKPVDTEYDYRPVGRSQGDAFGQLGSSPFGGSAGRDWWVRPLGPRNGPGGAF